MWSIDKISTVPSTIKVCICMIEWWYKKKEITRKNNNKKFNIYDDDDDSGDKI